MAIVGLERTFYRESEDVGMVEVCAVVISPNGNIPCPIMFPFNVSLSTTDDTAGITTHSPDLTKFSKLYTI